MPSILCIEIPGLFCARLSSSMRVIFRYVILPLALFALTGVLVIALFVHYPLASAMVAGILLLLALWSGWRRSKADEARGWRVYHRGRDQLAYEELRGGRWERMDIYSEMQTGKAPAYLIFFPPGHAPSWTEGRYQEILARIQSQCPPPAYAYETVQPSTAKQGQPDEF